MKTERELVDGIYAAAKLCRAAMMKATLDAENTTVVVKELRAGRSAMIMAAIAARKGIERGSTDHGLKKFHRLVDRALEVLGDYVPYADGGSKHKAVLRTRAIQAPARIDNIVAAYEVEFLTGPSNDPG